MSSGLKRHKLNTLYDSAASKARRPMGSVDRDHGEVHWSTRPGIDGHPHGLRCRVCVYPPCIERVSIIDAPLPHADEIAIHCAHGLSLSSTRSCFAYRAGGAGPP
jgi:hypothetical protein